MKILLYDYKKHVIKALLPSDVPKSETVSTKIKVQSCLIKNCRSRQK